MSQDSDTGSCATSSPSPSLLNNLRQFRFQKKALPKMSKIDGNNSTTNDLVSNYPIKSSPDVIECHTKSAGPISDSPIKSSPISESPIKLSPILDSPMELSPISDSSVKLSPISVSPIKSSPDSSVSSEEFSSHIVDSDCEEVSNENNPHSQYSFPIVSKEPVTLTIDSDSEEVADEVQLKERNLKFLEDAFPAVDKMVLQDNLVKTNWDIQEAMDILCKDNKSVSNNDEKCSRDSPPHKRKKVTICDTEDTCDVGNEEPVYQDDRVFDSDDSDQEICNDLTDKKQKVFDFLSTASANELRLMLKSSEKKVDAIIAARPFYNWMELVEKMKYGKFLGTDLLNSVQDLLYTRNVVQTLMVKCIKLATQMEHAVAAGCSSVKKQPSLLVDGLQLTEYQLVGLNWLLVMHKQGLNGILADEMGLGKTVQVIAFLAYLQENDLVEGPHLVVVPASTLENWANEFARWCPSLRVVKYYGTQSERQMMRFIWIREGLEDMDVILTTYNIMNSSSPRDRKVFQVLPIHYVTFDEAHLLKNMSTLRYRNLMKINAKHRVLLTGTPIQNSLLELMSLLIFVMPHMFAGKRKYLEQLFSKFPKQGSDMKEEDLPQFERQQVAQARRIMKPFVLRRLKVDVLKDLPTKSERIEICALAPVQQERYNNLIKSFKGETKEAEEGEEMLSGMAMVMQLRRIANHPALLRYHYTDQQIGKMALYLSADSFYKDSRVDYIQEDLSLMSDYELHQLAHKYSSLAGNYLPEDPILNSGKFKQLDSMLPSLKRNGDRVLIFSQFVIMLDILEAYLKIRGYKFLRLDGSTPVPSRQELIDLYNRDPSILVFLLSTRAGGQGINLTAANTVIIHDIDFNPYNDKQAEDRCHRVGQTRSVNVIRLISKGTIEEGILQCAFEKLKLEKDITNPDENEPMEAKNIASLLKQTLGLELTTSSLLEST